MPTSGQATRIEEDVRALVERFVAELGALPPRGAVDEDDALDRDLGLGSLERVELVLRLEQAFGVRLPDAVLAEANSPRDLARAVRAGGAAPAEGAPELVTPQAPARPAPPSARTLLEVLAWHAEAHPDRVHVFLRDDEGLEHPITYGALAVRAQVVAGGLRQLGIGRREPVAIMLRTEEAFFSTFLGVLQAGAVPVPVYPPFRLDRLEEYAARQTRILRNAGARVLLTFREAERVAGLLRRRVPSLRVAMSIERLPSVAPSVVAPDSGPDDPALIQYTSGSTGDPKGVLLSYANVLANIRAIGQAIDIRADDVAVSWLPLYHDMGLIGTWLGALYFGVPIAILSPLAFLARPARWLWTLHAHRGTISPAPNFAFDLCTRKIRDDELVGLDLSGWRLAFNGSEPVSPETIERFTRRFAPFGFAPEAMCPVYGLAEASVALTVPPLGRRPRVERLVRSTFERERRAVVAPDDDPNPLRVVSCGRPLPGHEVRSVDREGRAVGERVEGRVEFRGPSVTQGYFNNPAVTRSVRHDGWMDSGDLGYWADGELFVTGRQKDVIIKAGRNLYPQEVEELVGEVPGVRKGCVAAFGVRDTEIGTERLVVVAESRETRASVRASLEGSVRERVVAALDLPPDVIVIAPPGAVPKTSSGKIRRSAAREAYLRGDLGRERPSARVQWLRLVAGDLVGGRVRRLGREIVRLAFGVRVGLVLGLTVPALWTATVVLPGPALDRWVRAWSRLVLTLAGCRPRVTGLEHLRGLGPAVLAANHASYVDSVALFAGIPGDFRFVAKRELLRFPVVGTVIRKVGHPTVERADLAQSIADARQIADLLRTGRSLLFFPEGTFLRAPGLLPFRLGAFKIAAEAGCPVVPVTLCGTREILPADAWFPRPGRITITVGAPLRVASSDWRELVGLRDRVRDEIARRADEPPAGQAG